MRKTPATVFLSFLFFVGMEVDLPADYPCLRPGSV